MTLNDDDLTDHLFREMGLDATSVRFMVTHIRYTNRLVNHAIAEGVPHEDEVVPK